MKKILILLLLLTATAGAQVTPPFSFWKTSGPTFSPADIDSTVMWFLASDLADSLGKSSGDTLYKWNDRTGRFQHLQQYTDSKKMVYYDSSGAGRGKFVKSDGVDDFMRTDSLTNTKYVQPGTMFLVMRPYKNTGTFQFHTDGWVTDGRWNVYTNQSTNLLTLASVGTKVLNGDSLYIIRSYWNGASSEVQVNGIKYTGLNLGTGPLIGMKISTVFNNFSGALPSNAGYYEIIVIHRALTTEEETDMYQYLQNKHGVSW